MSRKHSCRYTFCVCETPDLVAGLKTAEGDKNFKAGEKVLFCTNCKGLRKLEGKKKLFNVYCICKVPAAAVVEASTKKEAFEKARKGDYIEFDTVPFSSAEKKSFYNAEKVGLA